MSRLIVVGCVLDEAGNVVGTVRSRTPASRSALCGLFDVQLLNKGVPPSSAALTPGDSDVGAGPPAPAAFVPSPGLRRLFEKGAGRIGEDPVSYGDGAACSDAEHPAPSTSPAGAVRPRLGQSSLSWRQGALALDKHDPCQELVFRVLRQLEVRTARYFVESHGLYRVARVLRCAAKKGEKLRSPSAWVQSALRENWDVDED